MTFEQILKIIRDTGKTDHQKAADLHAALISQGGHSLPAPAEKERRKRGPNKPKQMGSDLLNSGYVSGPKEHGET